MIIDNIIDMIDEGGPKSYYSFETFILNLLKYHIEQQNKEFQTVKQGPRRIGDAYSPSGFDELNGPTLIEVKFNLDRIPPRYFIEKILMRSSRIEEYSGIQNIILVTARPISDKYRERFYHEIKSSNFPVHIEIWGPEELNKIVNKHRKKSKEIVDNLFSLRLESAVSKPTSDWKAEREERVQLLCECYSNGQFSLFLGAGVSSSAGMPDWNTLLNSLFVIYLTQEFDNDGSITENDIAEIVDRLNEVDEPSALMAARYLRKGLARGKTETQEFTEAITKNLYKLRNPKYPLDSKLIKAIAALCVPKRTGAKVRSVITYNFDDLLERQLEQKSIEFHSIYTDNESYTLDEMPLYHVHGFLPEDKSKYDALDRSTLVFSEEGYHEIYSNAYHWSNLVQLNNLRENNCLMVGLSMTDPNLRRLLDISGTNMEKARHFAFMKRMSIDEFAYEENQKKKKQILSNINGAKLFLDRHHTLNEEIMKELGVEIIWYQNYDEIPEILKSFMNNK